MVAKRCRNANRHGTEINSGACQYASLNQAETKQQISICVFFNMGTCHTPVRGWGPRHPGRYPRCSWTSRRVLPGSGWARRRSRCWSISWSIPVYSVAVNAINYSGCKYYWNYRYISFSAIVLVMFWMFATWLEWAMADWSWPRNIM